MITTTDRQIERLTQLVDDLLDISRTNVGKLELNSQNFELADLVNDVVERFAGQTQGAACVVELECQNSAVGYWDRF